MVDQFELDVVVEAAWRNDTNDRTPSVYFIGRINDEPENQAGGQ